MKALVYRGRGSLVLEERSRPHPGEGQALLHVDACSICGTDLRIAAGTHRSYAEDSGRIPGHEIAGTVVETGDGVAAVVGERCLRGAQLRVWPLSCVPRGAGQPLRRTTGHRHHSTTGASPSTFWHPATGGPGQPAPVQRRRGPCRRWPWQNPSRARCVAHGPAVSALETWLWSLELAIFGLFHVALARLAGARGGRQRTQRRSAPTGRRWGANSVPRHRLR